jgi:GNAT superfamily N-acetyltransferase
VYQADLQHPYPPVEWTEGERLLVVGAENQESELTPQVRAFLGGAVYECLAGIRDGDRLFIIADQDECLHRGYVIFNSRAKKLIGENDNAPLIGYCYTAAAARGRGLYRRALLAEMRYLQQRGYKRVVIDTHPANQASRKGIEAAGFQFVRTVSVWIVLNLLALQRTEAGHDTRWRMLFL